MKSAAVGVLLCTSFLWAGSAHKPPESLVISNVNVVDTRYGGIHPNVTVVAIDGVIVSISKFALVQTGKHDRVINAEGKYLIPGLWDMHARLSMHPDWNRKSLLALYVVNGVTGLRDPQGMVEEPATTQPELPVPEIAMPGPTLHPELAIVDRDAIGGVEESMLARTPGAWLHLELEALAKQGRTPLELLQSATYNAALYMAKLDKYGVIERGHIADMVLLDENPLEDVRNTRKIAGVILRGTYFPRVELDALRMREQNELDPLAADAVKNSVLKTGR
jgi:adenine deaminase